MPPNANSYERMVVFVRDAPFDCVQLLNVSQQSKSSFVVWYHMCPGNAQISFFESVRDGRVHSLDRFAYNGPG